MNFEEFNTSQAPSSCLGEVNMPDVVPGRLVQTKLASEEIALAD